MAHLYTHTHTPTPHAPSPTPTFNQSPPHQSARARTEDGEPGDIESRVGVDVAVALLPQRVIGRLGFGGGEGGVVLFKTWLP